MLRTESAFLQILSMLGWLSSRCRDHRSWGRCLCKMHKWINNWIMGLKYILLEYIPHLLSVHRPVYWFLLILTYTECWHWVRTSPYTLLFEKGDFQWCQAYRVTWSHQEKPELRLPSLSYLMLLKVPVHKTRHYSVLYLKGTCDLDG